VNLTAPTVSLDVSGEARVTGNLTMNSSGKITNLVNPTANQDAATKFYVDNATTNMTTTSAVNTLITTALGSSGTMDNRPTVADAGDANNNYRVLFTQQSSGRATLNNDAGLTYNPNSNSLITIGRIGISQPAPSVPLDVSGAARITGNMDMNSSGKIMNLVDPTANQDAATKLYVDTQVSTVSTAATSAQTTANTALSNASAAQTKANSAYDAATAAQSTANSVSTAIQANGATASAQYLYPAPGNAASILTNGTYRLYVTTGGNVGIETTSPSAKLDINAGAGGSKPTNNPGIRVSSTGTSSILMRGSTDSTIKPEFELGTYNNISYVWNYTNTPMHFGTNGTERMRIAGSEHDGNVGIGTTSPSAKLDINAGAGGSKTTNNPGIRLSSTGTSSILMRGATDSTIKPEFELGTYNNMSYVWNYTDTPMHFGTNGTERMRIAGSEQDGNVGIGTTAPLAPLHVGGTTARTTPSYYYYLGVNANQFVSSQSQFQFNVSIISDGTLWVKGTYILMTSDKRIKKNIKEIAGNDALSQIRKIRPTIYNNIDVLKDQGYLYGFIAQEVEDVITNSTKKTKDYIPNIYCKGDIFVLDASNHIYEISSENELRFEKVLDDKGIEITNYKIKIYDDTNKEYICTVINTINVNTIHVKCDKDYNFSIVEEHKNKVFIYGQEVNDFNNLDKSVIFTVATAALQEVDRQQQADKARIAELENHVSNLEAKVSEQQSLINDILERLKTLEKRENA
jgi:Fe2+ or Zn2+ uptake regulation protein